jgi:hypothetical protein
MPNGDCFRDEPGDARYNRITTVGVAQLVRVPDCDSGCRGFESHRPPQFSRCGPLAQLVEQETLNLLVLGSSPRRPTIFPACLDPLPRDNSTP